MVAPAEQGFAATAPSAPSLRAPARTEVSRITAEVLACRPDDRREYVVAEHREDAGQSGEQVPRDMPDQQAHTGEDRWDVTDPEQQEEPEQADEDVPDTDEAGTGRQGAPHAATVHPEHPVPDEPTG